MKDFIVVNSIGDNIRYDSNTFSIMNPIVQKQTAADVVEDEGIDFYNENDYFFRSPRFKSKIEPVDIVVEDPPAKEKPNEMPMIYVVGPMLTMAMSSVAFGYTSLSGVINGTQELSSAMPTLVMSVGMLL